jgi:hypothetical protein
LTPPITFVDGVKAGVRGTPTFFLGLTVPDASDDHAGRVTPVASFRDAIEDLLAAQTKR